MTLLIVDDDIPTARAIHESVHWAALSLETVHEAHSITAAQGMMEQFQPEIVVCDIEMPRYTGIDLIQWARDNGFTAEFIFLTCHADFSYASRAIENQAAAYLIKPLDVPALTQTAAKVVEKILKRNQMEERSAYGDRWFESLERLENAFWHSVLFSGASGQDVTAKQVAHSEFGTTPSYRLLLCSVFERQVLGDGWDFAAFRYALTNVLSELVAGKMGIGRVISYHGRGRIYAVLILDGDLPTASVKERCTAFTRFCKEHLKCDAVCYIGPPLGVSELAAHLAKEEQADADNITRGSSVVDGDEDKQAPGGETIQLQEVEALLIAGRGSDAMDLIRRQIDGLAITRRLDAETLRRLHVDYQQCVFQLLTREKILAHELFLNDGENLRSASENSLYDMMKWISYLTNRALAAIADARKIETVVARVKRYVEKHFTENISRDDIARVVMLSPDYVSKLFRSETGCYLKDYINELRIKRAKELIAEGRLNISEVAIEIGFDNFSYFSTLFKRIADVTPSEYKRQCRQGDFSLDSAPVNFSIASSSVPTKKT
jgi:two-component system response regulator YesN